METSTLIYYMAGSLIGLVIFYNIIKAAVRNGIREARKDAEPPVIAKGIPDVKSQRKAIRVAGAV